MRKLAVLFLLIFAFALISCSGKHEFQQSRIVMGTYVTITLMAEDRELAEKAFNESFGVMESLEAKFSVYEDSSEVSLLNKFSELNASDDLMFLTRRAKFYSEMTGGYFDITVQPLLELYEYSFGDKGRPPSAEEINDTLKKVGYSKIKLSPEDKRIWFDDNSTKVTFGGIAKGYAVDKAVEELEKLGIESALVNAGGDMYALGKKNDGKWRLAVENPDGGYLLNFVLEDKAVATSGNYERFFDENKTFHHLVNPKTGYSADKCISVTIIASNATMADSLSTGVFAMGTEKGLELIDSIGGVEAFILGSDREVYESEGIKEGVLAGR